jgi:hypothetical protein
MRIIRIAAALALLASSSLAAQGAPVATDLSYAQPIAGTWTYAASAGGSEATFANASAQPQLTIRCTRSVRQITISKAASAAAPFLWVWTSSQSRNLPASYDAASARVGAQLAAFDPLLDAMAASRGRIGFATSGLAALVVPPWGEVGRVIEDCRV